MELDVQADHCSNTRKPHAFAARLVINLDQKSVVMPPKDLVLCFRIDFPHSDLPAATPSYKSGIWLQRGSPTNPYSLCAWEIALNTATVRMCPYRRVG